MNMILFENIPTDGKIDINDPRAKHILEVLKLQKGEVFKAGIINQSEGTAVLTDISDSFLTIAYTEKEKPTLYPVTLMVAQVRPICMKRILREAVSLGVERIILFSSDTGEKSYAQSNLYKTGEYKEYLLDGAMQACHAGLSKIDFACSLKEAIALAEPDCNTSLIMLDNITGATALSHAQIKEKAVLAIGPERGFSEKERKTLVQSNFSPMLLGSRVLRTETACSAGVAVLLSRMSLL